MVNQFKKNMTLYYLTLKYYNLGDEVNEEILCWTKVLNKKR
jgi:hypothetical protein